MKIGLFHTDDPFDLNQYECYIAPSWRFETLNNYPYDVCINIVGFQEMLQEHVDFYLDLFDRVGVDETLIYSSNAHDYYFKGEWNYPRHWRKVFCSNTPRSWTPYHPTEVFIKSYRDCSLQNAALDRLCEYEVDHPAERLSEGGSELFKRLLMKIGHPKRNGRAETS